MSAFKNPSAKRCRRAAFHTEAAARAAEVAKGPPWRARLCGTCGQWHLISDETTQLRLTPSHTRAVIAGRKTTHRIPAGHTRHCPYSVGGEYLIAQDNGDKPTTFVPDARIIVAKIERHPLGDTAEDTIHCEGFENVGEFLDYWEQRHGEITDRRLRADVWRVTFIVEHRDTVHMLDIDAGQAYTGTEHRALVTGELGNLGPIPEPESPDPSILSTLPTTREAQERYRQAKVDEIAYLEQLPLPERIRRVRELAAEKRIDISGPMKGVERQLNRALHRLNKAA